MQTVDKYARLEGCSDITLIKEVSRGNEHAYSQILSRYMELVSRTSFRILCDRVDSESVTVQVFVSLWKNVFDYDDRFSLGEWLLRKVCIYSRMRILRRRFFSLFGIENDVFVRASPVVDNEDDYLVKQAWELFCRASVHMTPLQRSAYSLCVLEGIDNETAAKITGFQPFRIAFAVQGASEKVRSELRHFKKEGDYDKYVYFLKAVAESLTDHNKLMQEIRLQTGLGVNRE